MRENKAPARSIKQHRLIKIKLSIMPKDALRPLLDQIDRWCRQNGIEPFYGELEEGEGPIIHWTRQEERDWEHFLKALSPSGSTPLIISATENDLDLEDEYITEYGDSLPEELKEEYRTALKEVKSTQGQLAYFTLTFFRGPACFQYIKRAPWFEEYVLVLEAYEQDEEDDPVQSDAMNPEQIEAWARKLIQDPKYQKAKDRVERGRIASVLFEQESVDHHADIFKILRRAESLFELEIQPTLEEELGRKVKELKGKGHKKVEVRAKLGISESTLNRHWY